MDNHGSKRVEEEFRSSQIYKTLKGSGIPAADKLAEGLGNAVEGIAQGLDSALGGISSGAKRGAGKPGGYYQNYVQGQPNSGRQTNQTYPYAQQPGQPARTPGTAQTAQTAGPQGNAQPPKGNGYSYQYTYSAGPKGQTRPSAGRPPAQGQAAPYVHPGRKPAGVSPAPAPQMKLVHKGSPAKFYITGIAALLYALNFPLYEISHFIVFGLVLVGVFLLSGKLFRGKKEFVPVEPEKPEVKAPPKKPEHGQEEKKASRTGNPEVDKIIDEGNLYLKKLRAANDAIPDESMSECIDRMERASADIFRYIADHPEKAPQIRKFMNYYLPTTLKLLNSYQRLAAQSVRGENITSTMFNIAGMMHTVADAFEKQLDSLFTDEAMDISADISVFETLLKQEGFVEEKAETKAGKS